MKLQKKQRKAHMGFELLVKLPNTPKFVRAPFTHLSRYHAEQYYRENYNSGVPYRVRGIRMNVVPLPAKLDGVADAVH